jgi:DNA-binding transcriptional LysR family regulator
MLSAMPMIETELLRTFVAFAEALNFTRAARKLGLSQPAFFERIERLSESVGAPLYQRQGRALVLTPVGTRLLAFAREIDGRFQRFFADLEGGPTTRRVTLAAGEGSYLYLLGPAITAFGPEIDLLTLGARAGLEALARGEADLAVGVIDLVPPGLDAVDLLSTPLCLAMPARHPLAKVRRLRTSHLAGERLILTPEGQLHRDLVGRALGRSGDSPRSVLEADGWPLMLKFVQLGLGVAVVNGICELPKGVVARPLDELGRVTYRLFTRKRAPRFAEVTRLETLIRQHTRASAKAK